MIFYIFKSNELKVINTQIKDLTLKEQNIKHSNINKETKTLESFECFPRKILDNCKSQNLYIENKNISISGYMEEDQKSQNYISIIKAIQQGNKFNIKDIHLPSNDSKFGDFKIDLELK